MTVAEWLVPSVVATLLSSLGLVVAAVVKARLDLRAGKLAARKAPAEITDLIAGASGEAVASVRAALQEDRERIRQLEADNAAKDREIKLLRADLNRAHASIGRLQTELDRLRPLPDHP